MKQGEPIFARRPVRCSATKKYKRLSKEPSVLAEMGQLSNQILSDFLQFSKR